MLVHVVVVVLGLLGLVWSADRFVLGAASLARGFGVPPMVVGLTVVAIGTSAPELLVSAFSSLDGDPGIAIGNALGSNIANVGLVVGATALVRTLTLGSDTLRRELPLLMGVTVLAGLLLADGTLSRLDGLILMGAFVVVMWVMVRAGLRARRSDPLEAEYEHELARHTLPLRAAILWTALGLGLLLASSRAVVWGAVGIAQAMGVGDLVIGLTVVAVGTSLPELGASLASALKGESDIAIGNVIGSNMFNLLPVLALPGIIAPGPVDGEVVWRDYPVMAGITLVLFVMAYGFRTRGCVKRVEGAVLLALFCAYQFVLYRSVVA